MTTPIAPCAQSISTETLSAWRDDGLPAAEALALAAHTPTCTACQAHLADYDAVARALVRQRELDPADRVLAGVRTGAARQQRRRGRAQVWGGLGALGSVAALVLLFVYVFGPVLGDHPRRFGYTTFHLPDPSYTVADLVTNPSGNAWFSEVQIVASTSGTGTTQGHAKIGRISPDGHITEYPLAATDNLAIPQPASSSLYGGPLTLGPDGAIWFTELAGGLVHTAVPQQRIVKLTADGTMTSYGLPGPSSIFLQPAVTSPLIVGPDGNLWFGLGIVTNPGQSPTDAAGVNTLARITPAGKITPFRLPSPYDQQSILGDLIVGPDSNLWFTVQSFNADGNASGEVIARATPSGAITIYPLPSSSRFATSLVAGPDGNVWFAEDPAGTGSDGGTAIAQITPAGHITEYPVSVPGVAAAVSLTPSRDGNLYFVEVGTSCPTNCQQLQSAIGRITPSGQISEYTLPNQPPGLLFGAAATGDDGSAYFTELALNTSHNSSFGYVGTNRIARITPSGHLSEYTVPDSSGGTLTLTAGASNTLWLAIVPPPGQTGLSTILQITLPAS
jgi:sugar lactone lactonase YvrE